MLLSPPRDIPEAELPARSDMEIGTRDVGSPVVMPRRVTPANRPLQHLEAGHLGASTPQHVMSRPAVPDLCITSSNLLSLMDPLPMDRLSRHTVAAICSWPQIFFDTLRPERPDCPVLIPNTFSVARTSGAYKSAQDNTSQHRTCIVIHHVVFRPVISCQLNRHRLG